MTTLSPGQMAGRLKKGLPFADKMLLDEVYEYIVLGSAGRLFLGWSKENMQTFIMHRLHKGRMILSRDSHREINGIGIWFRVPSGWDPSEIKNWPDDDEKGKEIYIAAMMADNPEARKKLVLTFISKEPDCLHLKLSALRQKGVGMEYQRVDYTQKILSKMLKL